MSMPTIEELIRLGCDRAGIGRDPRMLAAVKGMSSISNPDIARAAESYAYPARDEFELFTTTVVMAWHDALIAEAQSSLAAQFIEKPEHLDHWLRSMRPESGE